MKLTNNEIYNYATKLQEVFTDGEQKFPVKVNFYLQKNKKTLLELAQDIEANRMMIAQSYGELNEEEGQFVVPPEKIQEATQELNDLFNLEQEVQIYTIDIDNFDDNLMLTTAQMEALMFMIN